MGAAQGGWRREPPGRVRPCHRLSVLLTICIIAFALLSAAPALADVQYVYDASGRMVQVVAADGSSAVYQYDSAGNITAIQRLTANQLALTAFSPTGGGPGTQVAIQGSGFSTTPSADVVSFNGTAASVLSASANQLIVQVPSGATSGPISLTVGSQTVTSGQPFLILPLPTITSVSPTSGVVGTVVTLHGTNLNPVPGQTAHRCSMARLVGPSGQHPCHLSMAVLQVLAGRGVIFSGRFGRGPGWAPAWKYKQRRAEAVVP